eukprot:6054371-Amphidinium_carterae.1
MSLPRANLSFRHHNCQKTYLGQTSHRSWRMPPSPISAAAAAAAAAAVSAVICRTRVCRVLSR